MINPKDRTIAALARLGFRFAAHAYYRPGKQIRYTVVAKNDKTGELRQGWSHGGDAADALEDLRRRCELLLES